MAFELPQLDYNHDALEPHIDARTMEIHHGKHHAGYTAKLNAAVEGTDKENKSIKELMLTMDMSNGALRNNGGGYFNHCLFWQGMSPDGGRQPSGSLTEAIDRDFGSFDNFKNAFSNAAATQFGSGWCWLSIKNDKLVVTKTANAANPLIDNMKPILGCDVWEHSYYIDYRNRRPEYLDKFLDSLVNWEFVESLL